MRNISKILMLCLTWSVTINAQHNQALKQKGAIAQNSDIVAAYTDSLNVLINHVQKINNMRVPSPYMFRLYAPGTVYASALAQEMEPKDNDDFTDEQLILNEAINEKLNAAYVLYPYLFTATEKELSDAGRLLTDIEPQQQPVILTDSVKEIILPNVAIEAVEPEVKKPKFWTFKGNGSLQFTQTYFSDNWYQGGEKNYAMMSQLAVEANYDNKRRVQWDNKLEAQLGFQTSETDQYHKFKATSNLLRITSNLGIKAIGHWNYAAQLQLETQPYKNYKANSPDITAEFLSPLYVRSSIGMDYIIKKKRFEGKIHLAPLSYVITYVKRDDLTSRYGIDPGHNSKHDWGPNVDFTFTYKMWKNISWASRLYWFSNFHLTRIEWENTFNFTINKYLSAKLFLYPRFDDSSEKYRSGEDHDGTYLMFKEWFSLGLNYDF